MLPSGGNYAGVLGDAGIERVKAWVAAGGTVVALGDAVGFPRERRVDLLSLMQENALREGETAAAAAALAGAAGRALRLRQRHRFCSGCWWRRTRRVGRRGAAGGRYRDRFAGGFREGNSRRNGTAG